MANTDASKEILQLFQQNNKPFSANDIFEKFRKDFGKAAIQKALGSLLFREKIVEKAFGKQIIYFTRQTDYDPKEVTAELQMLTQRKVLLESNLKLKLDKVRELETKLKSFAAIPNMNNLEAEKADIEGSIDKMNAKLHTIRAKQSVKVSTEDIETVDKRHKSYLSIYRKRKRICTDMIDAILEGCPKSKKELIDDIGLETDEAVGFSGLK